MKYKEKRNEGSMWFEQWMWEDGRSEKQVRTGWRGKRGKLGPPSHLKPTLCIRETSLLLVFYVPFP